MDIDKKELDRQDQEEKERVQVEVAHKILQEAIEASNSPSRTSLISMWSAEENEKTTYCAYCGKELIGHFDVGTFTQVCKCKGAQKEHEILLKRRKLEEESKKLERELLKIDLDLLKDVEKSAIPHIKELRGKNNDLINEALDNYLKD